MAKSFADVVFYSNDLRRDITVRDFFKQLMLVLFAKSDDFQVSDRLETLGGLTT